jgi:predicted RNA-binding protein YlqC (UPF0109 family)
MEKDQAFVEMVVKEIVDNPSMVKTERKVDEMGVLIELTVAPEDMGKIIGKEGKTAKSVRTLLRVLGAKERARVNLKIIEPETGREVPSNSDSDDSPSFDTDSFSKKDASPKEDFPLEEKSTGVI